MTLEPNRDQTEPSSRPITPPPITVKFFGTFSSERAPVEETMVFQELFMVFDSYDFERINSIRNKSFPFRRFE